MAKVLTAAAVARLKPKAKRREVPDRAAKGLFLVIQPSGVKSWAYRFRRPGGKPAKLTLGPVDLSGREAEGDPEIGTPLTLAAARVLAAEVERQRKRGRDPAADHVARKEQARIVAAERAATTFGACAVQFIAEHKVRRSGERPRHWREVARILGLDYREDGEPVAIPGGLVNRWRDRPVREIGGHDVYSIIDESRRRGIPGLSARNQGMSDNRGRKMSDALGAMFGWLLQHRRVAANPCIGIWRPPPPAARQRVLNCKLEVRGADELRWFWSACEKVGEPFGQLFRLLLLCGCRRDELGQARWDELTDDLAVLCLDGSRTKNGRPHVVTLAPFARDILRSVPRIEKSPYVFSINGRTPVGGYAKAKKRLDELMLAKAQRECGEDAQIEKFVLHDLRRSCASGMAAIGIAPWIIERCLNHVGVRAGIAGVYNVEQHEAEQRLAWERWGSHIRGIVAGTLAKVLPLRARP
jgi:hypothetical protein